MPTPVFSQRYLRKGPLVEETYRLFSGWKDDASIDREPRQRASAASSRRSLGRRRSASTTSARLRNLDATSSADRPGSERHEADDWRDCWRLWIGATEEPFGGFVRDWLFPQMLSGRHHLRAEDAREYAINAWSRHSPKRPLSEYGVVRAARDLVHTAANSDCCRATARSRPFPPFRPATTSCCSTRR